MIRCLLVDDNASFLDAATSVLQRDGLTVAGTANTIDEALRRADELRPDAILVDIMLGQESGFDLARRLAEAGSAATVILISTHAEADFSELIDETPAAGFVPKSQLSAVAVRQFVSGPRGR
jgi:DNA-binding NarL/FixJ family response regulator